MTTDTETETDVDIVTANLFIDWSSPWHDPPWQGCNFLPINPGVSTVQVLLNEAAACKPPVSYTAIGTGSSAYLTSIDGVANNQGANGYYWVYLVNGSQPTVGFGAYVLNANDSVVWDYKHFSSGLCQPNDPDHPANKK